MLIDVDPALRGRDYVAEMRERERIAHQALVGGAIQEIRAVGDGPAVFITERFLSQVDFDTIWVRREDMGDGRNLVEMAGRRRLSSTEWVHLEGQRTEDGFGGSQVGTPDPNRRLVLTVWDGDPDALNSYEVDGEAVEFPKDASWMTDEEEVHRLGAKAGIGLAYSEFAVTRSSW